MMLKWIILNCVFIWASGAPSEGEDLRCKACHTLVEEIRDLIQVKDPQTGIIEYFKEICEKLRSDEKDVCYFFLQDHSRQLFDKLAADLTPNEICQKLPSRICQAPEIQPDEEPADEPYREPEEITIQENQEPEVIAAEENIKDVKCDLCKLAVQWVDREIQSNRSIEAINTTLEKICQSLSGEIGALCNTIEPYLINAVQQGIPADEACKVVQLCTDGSVGGSLPCETCYITSTTLGIQDPEGICSTLESCQTEVEAYPQQQKEIAPEEPLGPLECDVCKFVCELVDKYIENNKTEAAINATLEKVCNSLPGEIGDLCKQYEPEILQVIEQGLDPDTACKVIKLCSDGNIPVPCDVCYTVSQTVGIKDPEGICSQLESCQTEAEAYQQNQEPEKFPEEEVNQEEWEPENIHDEEPQDDFECDVCKFICEFVERELNSSKSIAAINSTLEKLCNAIPDAKAKSTCIEYEPQIIALISQGIPPNVVCTLLKICKDSYPYISQGSIPCDVCQSTMQAVAGERGIYVCFEIPGICLMPGQLIEEEPEPPRKPVPECEVCQFMVQSVSDQVQSFGKDKIVEVFERICGQMPEQEQQFCTRYGSHVIRSVMGGVTDPRQSCVAMSVCGPIESEVPEEEEEPVVMEMDQEDNVGDDGKCEVCKLLMNIVDQIVKDNKTMSELNATLFGFCDHLPTTLDLQKLCYSLVPEIEQFAKQGLNPTEACQAVNMCPKTGSASVARRKRSVNQTPLLLGEIKSVEKQLTNMKNPNGIMECEACKIAVRTLDNFLKENKTEKEVNSTVYEICLRLSGQQLVQMCLQAVPKLMPLIMKGLDPDQVCQAIGVCNKTSGFHDNDSGRKLVKRSADLKTLDNLEDAECDLCKAVCQWLDSQLEKNATEKKINDTVYELCNDLPGSLKDLCLQYADRIVKVFEKGLDPEETCQKIGLCTSVSGKSKKFKKLELSSLIEKKKVKEWKKDTEPNDLKCEGCKVLVNILDGIIEKNSSREAINNTIYKFCESLNKTSDRLMCLAIAPTLLNMTKHGFNATKVCQMVGLCPNTSALSHPVHVFKIEEPPLYPKESIECELCKAIIQEIDEVLEKNATFKKINDTVYGICNRLPKEYKDIVKACDEIAPRIVELIAGGADPNFVCDKLGVCKDAVNSYQKPKKQSPVMVNQSPMKCGICMRVVETVLEDLLENYPKIKRAMMNNVCNKLPDLYKAPCTELSSSDLSIYWKQFLGNYSPSAMCEMAGCEVEYYPDYPSEESSYLSKDRNRT